MHCQSFEHNAYVSIFHKCTNSPFLRVFGSQGCEVETGSNYVAQVSLEFRIIFNLNLSSCLSFPGTRIRDASHVSQPWECNSDQSQQNSLSHFPIVSLFFFENSDEENTSFYKCFASYMTHCWLHLQEKKGCSGQYFS